jgi:hypothetical protein
MRWQKSSRYGRRVLQSVSLGSKSQQAGCSEGLLIASGWPCRCSDVEIATTARERPCKLQKLPVKLCVRHDALGAWRARTCEFLSYCKIYLEPKRYVQVRARASLSLLSALRSLRAAGSRQHQWPPITNHQSPAYPQHAHATRRGHAARTTPPRATRTSTTTRQQASSSSKFQYVIWGG